MTISYTKENTEFTTFTPDMFILPSISISLKYVIKFLKKKNKNGGPFAAKTTLKMQDLKLLNPHLNTLFHDITSMIDLVKSLFCIFLADFHVCSSS